MYKLIFYRTPRGKFPVIDFIEQLDKKSQAKIYSYLTLLKEEGHLLSRPYADKASGKIRYLRPKTKASNIRIFYFFFLKNDIIILHSFKKKTQRLPEREIKMAEQRMEDFIVRYKRGEFK